VDPSENAQQLWFVVNAVPALIAYVDPQCRYVWANEGYRRWFGQPPERIPGLHVRELLGPAAWEVVRPYVERALSGEEVNYDQRLVFKSGPPRDVRAAYVPHFDADGRVQGFVVLVHDMTAIRSAELALRRSERMLEHSQSTAHVGSWEASVLPDGTIDPGSLRWSDEAYRIFGFRPREVEVSPSLFYGLVHAEDRGALRALSKTSVERVAPFDKEYRIVRPDGSVRTVHSWIRFECDEAGKPLRMLGTVQDITAREEAERALREADRRKDEFLAMLAHELRNPLAPILSAVEVLERLDPRQTEQAAKSRAIVARQVQHMKRLLDDLLDISRVSQGKIQLNKAPVELGSLLLQAVEISRPVLAEKRHMLSLALAPEPLALQADPTRLVQVFANLLNNAAKYTDSGGHIALAVSTEGDEAVVCVRDDGMGMSPELLARAFDLFVQETRSLDRSQGGLGVGLTMVRTLVKMHGGSVSAASDGPGRGSEFVVRLPLASEAEASAPASAPLATGARERSLRVLVVDDNVDAAGSIGVLLEQMGHEVMVAYDGPGALAAAAVVAPELVLLDIGLPGMDGYAVAEQLRGAGHDRATLVALTGYGQEEHLRRSKEAGFDRHLVKPLDFDALGEVAAQAAARRTSSGAAQG
jgi:PAS domain S-box-containing protein